MNRGMRELIAEELAIDIAEKYPVLDSCDKCGELLNNSFKQIPTSEGIKIVCEKCYGYRVMPEKGLEMREKPIIFNTEMVNAILDGRKTMTRRVIKPQPETIVPDSKNRIPVAFWVDNTKWIKPPYQPGDILWVRETTYLYGKWIKNSLTKTGKQKFKFVWDNTKPVIYAADNKPEHICKGKNEVGYFKRPSIFMPREAARIFLTVTAARVESLQDISANDVLSEGIKVTEYLQMEYNCLREMFSKLWDSLNAKRGYGWETNPWVWVYELEVREVVK